MKKKEIIVIIISFILISCTKNLDFVRILTKDNEKSFWVEKKRMKDNHLVYINNQWVFYPNKSAKCLVSFNPQKRGTPVIMNIEGSSDYSWSYNFRDSILDIGSGVKYKIVKYNTDTISMVAKDGNHFVLTREQDR